MPVSIRSVSIEGTSIWSFCEKTPAIRSHNDGAAAIDSSTPPSSGRGFMIFELLHELRAIDFSVGVFRQRAEGEPVGRQHVRRDETAQFPAQHERRDRVSGARHVGAADPRAFEPSTETATTAPSWKAAS